MKSYSIVMVVLLTLLCAGIVAAAPVVTFQGDTPVSGTNSTNVTVYVDFNVTNAANPTTLCNLSFYGGTVSLKWGNINVTNATAWNNTYALTSGGNAHYYYNITCTDTATTGSSETRLYTWDNTGPAIASPTVTTITEASGTTAGVYTLSATITDALVGLNTYNITVDGDNYALVAMGSDVYGRNFTLAAGSTHSYVFNAWDKLSTQTTSTNSYTVSYRYGCSGLVTIVFAALGLLSLVGIVLGAGWFMNNFGDGSLLMPLVLSVVTLGVVVMLGYVVVQNLSSAFC